MIPRDDGTCMNPCLELTYSFACNPLYVDTKRDSDVPFDGTCVNTLQH